MRTRDCVETKVASLIVSSTSSRSKNEADVQDLISHFKNILFMYILIFYLSDLEFFDLEWGFFQIGFHTS